MKYLDEVPQIKIDYRPEDDTLEEFISVHKDQTIYIDASKVNLFGDKVSLPILRNLCKYDNWVLQISLDQIRVNKEIDNIKFDAIKDCCNKFMFTDMIGNWEVLQFILSLHPCEVYITNMLAWELQDVRQVCGDVGIRLYANIAQSAWDGCPDLQKFFIRPEDLALYEEYTTGIELEGKTIQEVIYEIYKQGYWYGDLNEILINFNTKADSRRLPAEFGIWRLKCRKRCIKGAGCHLCTRMLEFADRMEKTNTEVIPPAKR